MACCQTVQIWHAALFTRKLHSQMIKVEKIPHLHLGYCAYPCLQIQTLLTTFLGVESQDLARKLWQTPNHLNKTNLRASAQSLNTQWQVNLVCLLLTSSVKRTVHYAWVIFQPSPPLHRSHAFSLSQRQKETIQYLTIGQISVGIPALVPSPLSRRWISL